MNYEVGRQIINMQPSPHQKEVDVILSGLFYILLKHIHLDNIAIPTNLEHFIPVG